ncbi:hypothetical protein DFH07DRAFT_304214 [Mycena maculata]|uniref:Uncharacterized protein n=1 Tax=Mycena maculata TaxID=230809 RepID=A0AAD7HIM5_9AGAR|nr:hypothetical protein DFH07DRAFT_304214 [Mycena maculata]
MGVDRGFDLYPPLENTDADNEKWARFLDAVITHYEGENDPNLTFDSSRNIVFTQGEHPALQRKGHRFRRFSSKVTGSHAGNVEEYLATVQKIAKRYFGDRVCPWNEYLDTFDERSWGYYKWNEVYAAAKEE